METLSERLARHGIALKRTLGQCFLVEPTVPVRIAEASGVDGGCLVVEIGPGSGALTVALAQRAAQVVAIELDRRMEPVLAETVGGAPNVELMFGDALKTDFAALCGRYAPLRPVICSNLPYYITSPLMAKILEAKSFKSATLMVQKEFAARVTAKPGSAEYGSFTVFAAYYAAAEALFTVPAACFLPRPSVDSTVIRLTARENTPFSGDAEARFFKILSAAFGNRRKTLRNNLAALGYDKETVSQKLIALGHKADARGEVLSMEEFVELTSMLAQRHS